MERNNTMCKCQQALGGPVGAHLQTQRLFSASKSSDGRHTVISTWSCDFGERETAAVPPPPAPARSERPEAAAAAGAGEGLGEDSATSATTRACTAGWSLGANAGMLGAATVTDRPKAARTTPLSESPA